MFLKKIEENFCRKFYMWVEYNFSKVFFIWNTYLPLRSEKIKCNQVVASFRIVVPVLLYMISSKWYHLVGNFMHNFFLLRYFSPNVHIWIWKWGKTATTRFFFCPLLSPLWTSFMGWIKKLPTFSDSVGSN